MAFVAASAQAQTGCLLNKTFITVTKEIGAQIHPLKETGIKDGTLDTELPATGAIQITCKELKIKDGLIFAGEKAEGSGTLEFTKCETFIKGKLNAACAPKEPIEATTKLHALLHLTNPIVEGKEGTHDGKTYILFEPVGKEFTTLHFGEECAFGEKVPITGEVVAECLNEKLEKNLSTTDYCLEDLVHHLIQEAPHKLFTLTGKLPKEEKWDELLFEGHLASLLGIVDTFDIGGGNWAVHI
jgi:hypothetical protein